MAKSKEDKIAEKELEIKKTQKLLEDFSKCAFQIGFEEYCKYKKTAMDEYEIKSAEYFSGCDFLNNIEKQSVLDDMKKLGAEAFVNLEYHAPGPYSSSIGLTGMFVIRKKAAESDSINFKG